MSEHADELRERLKTEKDIAGLETLNALLAEHRAALSRARAEALEEAVSACNAEAKTWGNAKPVVAANRCAERIRALITTPAPATIPVERVREVLARRMRYAASEGHGWVAKELGAVAADLAVSCECSRPLGHPGEPDCLDVPLDAATEAPACPYCTEQHSRLTSCHRGPCIECGLVGTHKVQRGRRP